MMIDVRSTIASGMDRLDEGDVNGAQADYDLIRETYPVESEWMMDVSLRADLYELRDGIRNARKMVARV